MKKQEEFEYIYLDDFSLQINEKVEKKPSWHNYTEDKIERGYCEINLYEQDESI